MEKEIREKTGYPSIDKPWLQYYPENVVDLKVPEKTIYQLLEESNKERPNQTLMTFSGLKIPAKKYIEMIKKTAKSLDMIDVKKDEIIVSMLPNIPESRTLIYGDNILNSIIYPVTPMISTTEFDRILRENEVKTIVIFEMFYEKYRSVIENNPHIKSVVFSDGRAYVPNTINYIHKVKNILTGMKSGIPFGERNIPYSEFMKLSAHSKKTIEPLYIPNSTAAIIGTSGTTGTSKGVCLTNENLNAMALQHQYGDMNFEVGDKLLDLLIQSIGYGIGVAHYSGVCGVNSILIPTLETNILPLMDKYKPLHFTGGPIHYENLMKDLIETNRTKPEIKNMVSGGAALSKEVEMYLNEIVDNETPDEEKVFVRQGLGCTENGGAATYAKKGSYKFRGVGIPLCMEIMSVFEPGTDKELPYNTQGELCITGPTVMKEYLNNESETELVLKLHSDGRVWLHTCDIGYMDEDGQVYLTDRIKNIFMRKGFNVHPSKISEHIASINKLVDSCYVCGIEHPDEQCVPVAFIKLNENVDEETALSTIRQSCLENLEESSVPYEYIVVDTFPRNLGGKIDKKALIAQTGISYTKQDVVLKKI